jgi:hypothetical protein
LIFLFDVLWFPMVKYSFCFLLQMLSPLEIERTMAEIEKENEAEAEKKKQQKI